MSLRYATLFEVRVAHDYFLSLGPRVHEALDDEPRAALARRYSLADFLEVAPDAATRDTLAGHRWLFRATPTGFLVACPVTGAPGAEEPTIPPAPDLRLRFALRTHDRCFANYTALPAGAAPFYRFTNSTDHSAAGQRFLSRPVPSFDPDRAYEAGEVRVAPGPGGTLDLLRAERDTGPSPTPVSADWRRIPPDTHDAAATYAAGAVVQAANRLFRARVDGPGADLSDAADWESLGALAQQYVTAADAVALHPPRFAVDLGPATVDRATVQVLRPADSAVVAEATHAAAAGVLGRVTVEAADLPAAAYRLRVLGAAGGELVALGRDLYLDAEAARQRWLGVVEIGPGAGGAALLAGDGTLLSPVYHLRLLNRATRWRYLFPHPQAPGSGAQVAPEAGEDRVLVTAETRPLTRTGGHVLLQADDPATTEVSEEVPLPLPEVGRVRRQNAQWFSEVHTVNHPI